MIVFQKESGDIRICGDLPELNRFARQEAHPISASKHLLAQFEEEKVFSKTEANEGFWHFL